MCQSQLRVRESFSGYCGADNAPLKPLNRPPQSENFLQSHHLKKAIMSI